MQKFKINAQVCIYSQADLNIGPLCKIDVFLRASWVDFL